MGAAWRARQEQQANVASGGIVFLNDVYFCARDTIRLLQHDGDMVCGLDFDRPKLEEMPGEVSCFSRRSIGCALDIATRERGQDILALTPGSPNPKVSVGRYEFICISDKLPGKGCQILALVGLNPSDRSRLQDVNSMQRMTP